MPLNTSKLSQHAFNPCEIPILVVDDLQDNLDLMDALLADEGYEDVLLTSSGEEALQLLDYRVDIGLVLLDLMMPEMSGYEVCQRIRDNPKTQHIPVIVITGGAFRQNEALVRSFASGAIDYVQKPLNEVELFARVRVALQLYHERVLRQHGMQRITESEERYRTTFDQAPVGIAHVDLHGTFLMVNQSLCELIACSYEDIIGQEFSSLQATDTEPLAMSDLQQLSKGESLETCLQARNGKICWVNLSVSPLSDQEHSQASYILIIEDITERKQSADRLQHMAFFDHLTGLPNRVLFHEELERSIQKAKHGSYTLAVLFLDLDHFKNVNDSLGHEVGDLLLKGVSQRIQSSVRSGDTLARLGGDEFGLLLPKIREPDDACLVAQKILSQLRSSIVLEDHEFYAGASIGISVFPQDGIDAKALLKNADAAMYRAKDLGRHNYQLFNPSLDFHVHQRLDLEQDLHRAMECDEFELYYQPQVNLQNHEIIAVEALLRWNHPKRGLISPDHYLPLAEETGLIISLGHWVLEQACRQSRAWLDQGLDPIVVYINLSLRQFQQANLVRSIESELANNQLSPQHFGIEITESVNSLDKKKVIRCLQEFHELGVQTALDDFGMGYSSLNHLKHFPLHQLKIDKSFVQNAIHDPNDKAIINAIITLGKSFGLKVVAEGVETIDELRYVTDKNCDIGQGYLFSKPVPAQQIVRHLQDRKSMAITVDRS